MIGVILAAQLSIATAMATPQIQAYQDCLVGSAVALEGSNDRPDEVAAAAEFICRVKEFELLKGIPAAEREGIKSGALRSASAMVTIYRACKRANQCAAFKLETARLKPQP